MASKKEHLLACQERTWAAIENSITIFHLLFFNTSPILKAQFPKVTGDESGRSPMSSSDMTLVFRVVQRLARPLNNLYITSPHIGMSPSNPLLATPILYFYPPQVSMAIEPPTKVSPYGTPATAFPQRRICICWPILYKEIHTTTQGKPLRNVANTATKALQAAFKFQWPRSPGKTDTLLVRKIIGNNMKKNSSWLISSPIEGWDELQQADMEECRKQDPSAVLHSYEGLHCSRFYKIVTRLLISQAVRKKT